MQFVKCRFQSNSSRFYTYAWDGAEPLVVGDKVDVETERGEITVEVAAVLDASDHPSPKLILRKIEKPAPSRDEQSLDAAKNPDPALPPIGDGQ